MVQTGEITVGGLTSFFLYTAYVGSSMIGLSSWYSEFMKGIGASSRLFELLDKRPNRQLTGKSIVLIARWKIP
jgi:ABC-type multidrug transport system fused ATPase/permease subunit